VVLGVLFPSQLSVFKPWVTLLFAFMTFQGALSNTFGNLLRTLRHPTQMLAASQRSRSPSPPRSPQ
jgi:predicted Na+-dependent transporter